MYQLQVSGMHCGHCISAITQGVARLDPLAQVKIDLPNGQVRIQSQLPLQQLSTLITDLGFEVISKAEV